MPKKPDPCPRGIQLCELDAAQLPRVLEDVDAAVINTNHSLKAGQRPERDALPARAPRTALAECRALRASSSRTWCCGGGG
ncbi:MAG: MetQ/NlpA family ABC transporter substrate-binding protein, partial [Kofleriaceae bacterium]